MSGSESAHGDGSESPPTLAPETTASAVSGATVSGVALSGAAVSSIAASVSVAAPGEAPSASGSSGRPVTPMVVAGRYEIQAMIGAGGMGTVYRARDLELDETVALKVLRKDAVGSVTLERFKREVKLARRVTHRNVARTFDIGEHQGERFLTMELVEGESLTTLARRAGKAGMGLVRTIEIATAICEGLAAAHDADVVHRDLKPDNVLVGRDGRVVITDFGIARAGAEGGNTMGAVVGTPAYMSTEQIQGREVDARTDLYSLGVMLYELLAGDLPFKGDSVFALAIARLQAKPPDPRLARPDLPPAIAELILALMAMDPKDRPRSARDVGAVLASVTLPMQKITVSPPKASATQASVFGPGSHSSSTTPPHPSTGPGPKTVAVLPFANQGPAEEAYLAEGLAQDIADTLSTTRGLRVRSALGQKYQTEIDPKAVGAELGVQVIVTGSVRRLGPRARISARAVSTTDGFQVWAGRFDRDASELLVVSDEVAREVAKALTVELREGDGRGLVDAEAVELYLKGRTLLGVATELRDIHAAVEVLEKARGIAPDDPAILSACALGYARLWFGGDPSNERQAREATEQAIRLAPNRGEPLLARGMLAYQIGDFASAIRDVKRAVLLAPSLPEAHHILGSIQLEVGPPEHGAQRLRTALLLEPRLIRARVELARYHGLMGEFDQAFATMDEAAKEGGLFTWIPRARLAFWEGSKERIDGIRQKANEMGLPFIGMMFDIVDRQDADGMDALLAGSPLGALERASLRGKALRFQALTEMNTLIGRIPHAIESLRGAVEAQLVDVTWIERCRALVELRKHPEFEPLADVVRARGKALRQLYAE